MTWMELKDKIYYWDGSWRDIVVQNTTRKDWQIWADFVLKDYNINFQCYEIQVNDKNIDLSKAFDYWDEKVYDKLSQVIFYIGNIKLNVHFFDEQEIEHDFNPQEVNSLEDHNLVIEYMTRLSKLLNKKVSLTDESTHEGGYISVLGEEVKISLY